MKPYWQSPCGKHAIHVGDCLDVLGRLEPESAQTCITSPPYFGLRDYGTAEWDGGDAGCDHLGKPHSTQSGFNERYTGKAPVETDKQGDLREPFLDTCGKCGAKRIDSQIGLEPTPAEYVEKMVEVFRGVRRVLRDDGTVWLNLGDSYVANNGGSNGYNDGRANRDKRSSAGIPSGLKPKDLIGIPWRVALALQQPYYTGSIKSDADRIWLAAMIDAEGCIFIHKRKAGQSNGQGYTRKSDTYGSGLEVSNTSEAVVLRCMEIVGKGSICHQDGHGRKQRLFRWNLRTNECRDVLREVYPHLVAKQHQARLSIGCPPSGEDAEKAHASLIGLHNGNEPSIDFDPPASMFEPGWYLRQDIIWKKPNPMPESVTDRCTKAHEYIFLLAKRPKYYYDHEAIKEDAAYAGQSRGGSTNRYEQNESGMDCKEYDTRNKRSVWSVKPAVFKEAHFATFPPKLIEPCVLAGCPVGGTVLDPFTGSGTTGMVAAKHGRRFVGIELNAEYADMAARRIGGEANHLFAGSDA